MVPAYLPIPRYNLYSPPLVVFPIFPRQVRTLPCRRLESPGYLDKELASCLRGRVMEVTILISQRPSRGSPTQGLLSTLPAPSSHHIKLIPFISLTGDTKRHIPPQASTANELRSSVRRIYTIPPVFGFHEGETKFWLGLLGRLAAETWCLGCAICCVHRHASVYLT